MVYAIAGFIYCHVYPRRIEFGGETVKTVARCSHCLSVGFIRAEIEGQWKGHKTLKQYCDKCTDALGLSAQFPADSTLSERVDNAIAQLQAKGNVFTISHALALICVCSTTLRNHGLYERVSAAAEASYSDSVRRAIARYRKEGKAFSVAELCRAIGTNPATLGRKDCYQQALEASKASRVVRRPDFGKRGPSPLDRQYEKVTKRLEIIELRKGA